MSAAASTAQRLSQIKLDVHQHSVVGPCAQCIREANTNRPARPFAQISRGKGRFVCKMKSVFTPLSDRLVTQRSTPLSE